MWSVANPAMTAGAKTHFHKAMSESFYILSGKLELFNGEKWVTGRAGEIRKLIFVFERDRPVSFAIA